MRYSTTARWPKPQARKNGALPPSSSLQLTSTEGSSANFFTVARFPSVAACHSCRSFERDIGQAKESQIRRRIGNSRNFRKINGKKTDKNGEDLRRKKREEKRRRRK